MPHDSSLRAGDTWLTTCASHDAGGKLEAHEAYEEACNAMFVLQLQCHRHAQPHAKSDGTVRWELLEMWPMLVCSAAQAFTVDTHRHTDNAQQHGLLHCPANQSSSASLINILFMLHCGGGVPVTSVWQDTPQKCISCLAQFMPIESTAHASLQCNIPLSMSCCMTRPSTTSVQSVSR